jgi:exonuclease I
MSETPVYVYDTFLEAAERYAARNKQLRLLESIVLEHPEWAEADPRLKPLLEKITAEDPPKKQ